MARPGERGAARSPSVQYVRLSGLDVDVMLPGSGNAGKRWGEYARRIVQSGTFDSRLDPELQKHLHIDRDPDFNGRALARLPQLTAVRAPERDGPRKPRVGIMVAELRHLHHDTLDSLEQLIEGIRKLGADPVLIPPRVDLLFPEDPSQRQAGIRSIINELDGLVGPGGWDIMPRMYWEKATHSLPGGTTPERMKREYKLEQALYARDRFGADVFKEALSSKKTFLFGICRSHQMLNLIHGGKLSQDMMKDGLSSHTHNQEEHLLPRRKPMRIEGANGAVHEHGVDLHGELASRLGASRIKTNAIHHQATETVGRELESFASFTDPVTGRTWSEGIRKWNAASVQWHPEANLKPKDADNLTPEDWGTFSLVGRAWAFHALKALTAKDGTRPTAEEVLAWCRAKDVLTDETDERWLLTEFKEAQGLR